MRNVPVHFFAILTRRGCWHISCSSRFPGMLPICNTAPEKTFFKIHYLIVNILVMPQKLI